MSIHRALRSLCLLVAAAAFSPPAAAVDWTYTVRPGDSAWTLARRFCREKTCWPAIARYNNLPTLALPGAGRRVRIPVALLSRRPISATAVVVRGAVFLRRRGQPEAPLPVGNALQIDDRVRTADGSATVRFADGSEVLLGEGSEMQFDMLGAFGDGGMVDTQIRVLRGRLEPRVQHRPGGSSFRIVTPTGTAVVRGTEFRVRAEGTQFVELTQGSLAFASTALAPGFGLVSQANSAPLLPEALLPAATFVAPAVTGSAPLRVAWNPVPGATGYRVLLFAAGTPAELLSVSDAIEPALALTPPRPGQYVSLVRAISPSGLEGLDAQIDLTLLLAAPDVTQAAHAPAEFHWLALPGALEYLVQTARDPAFVLELKETPLSDTRYVVAYAPGKSWFRLRARTRDGTSEFSPAFEVRQTPPQITLDAAPLDWDTNAWLLHWQSVPNARTRMQIAPDPGFGSDTRDLVTELSSWSLLCPFRKCSVRVRAEYPVSAQDNDGATAGPWSAPIDLRNWLMDRLLGPGD